jgi:Fe-Mn family superoxide dismutase
MHKQPNRRQFISHSLKAGMLGMLAADPALNLLAQISPGGSVFSQQPLPYAYDALEPHIDKTTMELHYSKHAAAYCKNLNEAVAAEANAQGKTLEELMARVSTHSTKLRNNGGGHYNHEFFWRCLKQAGSASSPDRPLHKAISRQFGSIDEMKKQFSEAAKSRFGSGWAWLVRDADGKLIIGSTPNQDNPLMDLSELKGRPLLALDVWEHAYYLKYQNRRAEYIEGFWNLVDWAFVSSQYNRS